MSRGPKQQRFATGGQGRGRLGQGEERRAGGGVAVEQGPDQTRVAQQQPAVVAVLGIGIGEHLSGGVLGLGRAEGVERDPGDLEPGGAVATHIAGCGGLARSVGAQMRGKHLDCCQMGSTSPTVSPSNSDSPAHGLWVASGQVGVDANAASDVEAGASAQLAVGLDAGGDDHAVGGQPAAVSEGHRADVTRGVAVTAARVAPV